MTRLADVGAHRFVLASTTMGTSLTLFYSLIGLGLVLWAATIAALLGWAV